MLYAPRARLIHHGAIRLAQHRQGFGAGGIGDLHRHAPFDHRDSRVIGAPIHVELGAHRAGHHTAHAHIKGRLAS